jgi:uncharacterized protein
LSFFARLCRDHARAVIIVCLLLTIPMAVGMSFIKLRAGQKDLIPSRLETSRTLGQVDQLFGGTTNEYPMVESDALLTYPMIKKLLLFEKAMADALGEDQYVYVQHFLSAYGQNVVEQARQAAVAQGLTPEQAAQILTDVAMVLEFGEGTSQPDPADPARIVPFEQVIEEGVSQYLADPVVYKWTVEKEGSALLSGDHRYAKILIKVNPALDSPQRKAFAKRAEEFFHSYFEGGEAPAAVYVSGDPSIDKDLEDYVSSSSWIMVVIALAMLMVLLYLTFRRVTDVLLPLVVIVLTMVWVYGLMGWLKLPFTLVSAIIGPLLLGICLGKLIHLMGRFYEESGAGKEPPAAAHRAVMTVGVAIFLACVTTIFGFASFGLSDLDILQEFGYMAAAGIAFCFVFSVTFLPAMMGLRDQRRQRRGAGRPPRGVRIFDRESDSPVDRLLGRIAGISQKDPRSVVILYGFVVLLCVISTFKLTTMPDLRALAPQDIPSLQAQYMQEGIFGGQQQDVVLLTGDVLQPETLAAMHAFQDDLAGNPYFGENGSSSIAELIHDYRVETGEAAAGGLFEESLPADAAGAEQDLASIAAVFGPQEGKLVSQDHQAALITVFSGGARSNVELKEKNRALNAAAAENFGKAGIPYLVGGITPLTAEMLGNLVPTQIKTSLLALFLSGLVLMLIFRSFEYGLATLSVLVAGVSVELGFISLMGWTLDVMTVLIVSMIIGLGVDYGIHVTHRFLEEYTPGETGVAEAMHVSVVRIGKTLVAGTVSTAGAFLVIAFSSMQPIRRFGLITALSLTVSLLASLLVLPSIITLIERRRLARAAKKPVPA